MMIRMDGAFLVDYEFYNADGHGISFMVDILCKLREPRGDTM
jgi:hypothetical protein